MKKKRGKKNKQKGSKNNEKYKIKLKPETKRKRAQEGLIFDRSGKIED